MLNKKRVKAFSKKAVIYFVTLSTILWSMGLPLLPVQIAQATVTTPTYTSLVISGQKIGPNGTAAVLKLSLAADASETLLQAAIDVLTANNFDVQYGLAPLSTNANSGMALYRDNPSAGTVGSFDQQDTFLPLATAPAWSGTTPKSATLVLSTAEALTSVAKNYFVVAKTSPTPAPNGTFKTRIAQNGATASTGVVTSTVAEWAAINPLTIGQVLMGSSAVISEVMAGQTGNTNYEFVELYNRSSDVVNLAGYYLHIRDAAGVDAVKTIDFTAKTVAPFGFFLIASSQYTGISPAANVTYDASSNALLANGSVYISTSATALTDVLDKVGWGTQASGGYEGEATVSLAEDGKSLERKSYPEATAASMFTGGPDNAMGNGSDSNNNWSDFVLQNTAVPQSSASAIENPQDFQQGTGQTPVVLNEVLYNTVSGSQWIEVYNRTANPVDITNWKIIAAGKTYTFGASVSLAANTYAIVYWNKAGTNTATTFYTGTGSWADLSTLAGDIVLKDGANAIKDYVQYGAKDQTNEAAVVSAGQWMDNDYVANPLYNQSIGRANNGSDINRASDWQTYAAPTPGAPNIGGDTFAPDAVTAVILSDTDTTNYGIDGRDVSVTWTPATLIDPTFGKYVIYLLPAATPLNQTAHIPFVELFGGQTVVAWTGGPGNTKDSANSNLASGGYKAYVMAVDQTGNKSSAVSSATATLTSDTTGGGLADDQSPMIMAMPLSKAKAIASTIIVAKVGDDRGLDAITPTSLNWRLQGPGAYTSVAGISIGEGFYTYTIPWGAWTTSTIIDYYLVAKDNASPAAHYTYFTSDSQFDMNLLNHTDAAETTAATKPLVFGFSDVGYTRTISGTVFDQTTNAALDQAKVFIPGSGLDVVTVGTNGIYSFTTVADGNYTIIAFKSGYKEWWIEGISINANNLTSTNNNFYLNTGSSGTAGTVDKPFVKWVDPSDGTMGAPIDISLATTPIVAHISRTLKADTVTDNNAADAGSNVYLTTTSLDRVAGAVTYDSALATDIKIKFSSITPLNKGQTYIFVITPSVTDESGNSIKSNQPDGKFVSTFTTFADVFFSGAGAATFGQGTGFPPYVTGSMPAPNSINIPTNAKLTVSFSEPMDASTIESTSSQGNYLKLYDTNYQGSGSGQYLTVSSITLDDAFRTVATINAGTLTASHHYAIRVLGGAKSAKGITIGNPLQSDYASLTFYQADFDTGAGADNTAPTILGSNLKMYSDPASPGYDISVSGYVINVPTNIGMIRFGFSKDMDASTINATNITLKAGTTSVTGTVSYDPMERKGSFTTSSALNPSTTYTFLISTDVKALNAQPLASAYKVTFTTSGTTDAVSPIVSFARASEFKAAVTFSEPMNAAKITDTSRWTTSVLNPVNYRLNYKSAAPGDPGYCYTNTCEVKGSPTCGLLNASTNCNGNPNNPLFKYDSSNNTVIIEGLELIPCTGPGIACGFGFTVENVTDLSSNSIATAGNVNIGGGPVEMSSTTGGMMGPGPGGMAGPPSSSIMAGTFAPTQSGMMTATTDFGGKDVGMMGMKPIGVWPMNMLAGAASLYMVDIPISQQIPAPGGKLILTFPSGFDVSGAKNADPTGKFAHYDINGPGLGKVVLATNEGTLPTGAATGGAASDGVYVMASPTMPQVVILLGAVATQTNDFLHLEIDGIKNSTESKDFNTSGYRVNIKTFAGSTMLESLDSMSFFIKAGGTSTLTGTITFKDDATPAVNTPVTVSNLPVFLMSPMTGPLEVEVNLTGVATKTYTIRELPAGQYMVATEPLQSIGGVDYYADLAMPSPITIGAGANTKDITFTKQSTTNKAGLIVYITGTFTNEDIDIFAGGPAGFTVKTVTLNGTKDASDPFVNTIYLPSTGTWMVGMGPAMPKGPIAKAGAPMTFNWMPPKPMEIKISGTPSSWTWKDEDGAAVGDTSAADGKITFGISSANKTITGYVQDAVGIAIANAEVFAYSPMGGFGNHTQAGQDGSFSLNVTEGMYKVGAMLSGMPPSQEMSVEVKSSTIYVNGVATSSVVLKVAKPDYTISGTVSDGTNVIKDAPVFAWKTDGPGRADSMTDSMGKFILYVTNGTWKVNTFLPGYGQLTEQTITINNASSSGLKLMPATATTFVTVTERVYKDVGGTVGSYDVGTDTPITGAHVIFEGTNYTNDVETDSSGVFSTKVPTGTYTIKGWSPTIGGLPSQSNVSIVGNITLDSGAADIPVAITKTVTVNFKNSSGQAVIVSKALVQLDKLGSKNISNDLIQSNVSTLQMEVPSGASYDYAIDIDVPGIPDQNLVITGADGNTVVTASDINADLTNDMYKVRVDGNEIITVTLPTLYTVSGQVTDGTNPVGDAVVHIEKPGTDLEMDIKTNATGNYSVQLPASGATPYLIQADKTGYVDTSFSLTVAAAAPNTDLSVTKASQTITGQIKVGTAGVSNAQVVAEQLGGGFVATKTDPSGNYTLNVIPGDWKVSAASSTYQGKTYTANIINVSSATVPNINITLDTLKTGLATSQTEPLTSSSGGTVDRATDAGFEMSVPTNAIKTATQSYDKTYSLQSSETSNVLNSATSNVIGGEAIELSGFIYAGSTSKPEQVTSLSKDVMIDKIYTLAQLATDGIDTFAEVEKIKMATFDDTAQNWVNLPTTLTYLDSSDYPVIPTNTLSNVAKVIVNGAVDHFSVFAPTNPIPDNLAPAAPTGLTQSTGTGSAVVITWTAPTLNADGSAFGDWLGYEIYRSTNGTTYTQINASNVLTTSYTDNTVASFTSYYYKVTAADTGGIESVFSSANQVCSNKTISNGTMAVNCTITCDATTGYVQSGNTCVAAGTAYAPSAPTTPAAPVTASTTTTISAAAGGTTPAATTTEGATAKATIPTAAVTANTAVSITPTATTATAAAPAVAAVPSGMGIAGGFVYNYSATSAGQAVTTFAKPVTLTFTYTDSQVSGLDESTLTINYWDAATSKWVTLPTTINTANNTLTAATTHFTYFAILGNKTAAKPTVTTAQLKAQLEAQIIAIMKQIIVLITQLIAELQAKLAAMQT